MRHSSVKKLTLTAMMMALTCIATMVIRIPTPTGGYANLGDTMVILSAILLGPWLGMAAAGIGSAMCDFLTGYMVWVPATLIIKAVMALIIAFVYRRKSSLLAAAIPAELFMILGYCLFEAMLMGQGIGALAGIPGNGMQALFSLIAAAFLNKALLENHHIHRFFSDIE